MPVTINGTNTPTAGGVTYGDGTTYATTSAGTSGQALLSGGAGAPTWGTPASATTATTATNLAGGAQGSVPYQSAAGTTALLAAGTSGQVLTTQGAGANPTWTTIAASAMVLISTKTASSSSDLNWTGLSGYNRYLLVFDNLLAASSTATLNVTVGTGSTPTYITSNYTEMTIRGAGVAPTGNGGTGRSSGYIADPGSSTTYRLSGYCVFNGMTSLNQVSAISTWNVTTSATLGGGLHFNQVSSGGAAITAIKINFASGNISSGNATLYGLTS